MQLFSPTCSLAEFVTIVPLNDSLSTLRTIQSARCENQIEELCLEIEKTINRSIQNTLNTLERDAQLIVNKINEKLQHDR